MNYVKTVIASMFAVILMSTNSIVCYAASGPGIDPELKITIDRFVEAPIITPELSATIGNNIQGPCLIKVPDWVESPLGTYYLYFADHKGAYIRLAYADQLKGPWKIYEGGSLQLMQTTFLHEPPILSKEQEAELPAMAAKLGFDPNSEVAHSLVEEATAPHIASPFVRVDEKNKQIIMYVHGLKDVGVQTTRVAASKDGIHFEQTSDEDLGTSYLRVFDYNGMVYGMTMPGQLYRSKDGMTGFEKGSKIFNPNFRHHDLLVKGNTLYVFYTQVGDSPEQIYVSTVNMLKPWEEWKPSKPTLVMKPETNWEGADAPAKPSIRSTAYGHVNQLRDPFIYEEDDQMYILYAVAGESGIGIAKLSIEKK